MNTTRRRIVIAAATLLLAALGLGQAWVHNVAMAQSKAMVEGPKFAFEGARFA